MNPITIVIIIMVLYQLTSWLWERYTAHTTRIPLAGSYGIPAKIGFVQLARVWLREGMEKFPGQLFRLWTPEGYLHVATLAQLYELNLLRDDQLRPAFTDVLMGQYTDVTMSPMGLRALKKGLKENHGSMTTTMIEEAIYRLRKSIPSCEDWNPVKVYNTTTVIAGGIASRIMTGPELGHNQEWTDLLLAYSADAIECAVWLKMIPRFARRAVLPFLPPMRRIKQQYKTAYRLAAPILEQRARFAASDPQYERYNDLLQWIADRAAVEGGGHNFKHQAGLQLSAGLASIWSTSKTCTQALYDLASYPEHIGPLREEIDRVFSENNDQLTREGLAKLDMLDSFMKESQRHNVAKLTAWDRQALEDIHLKDGTLIPKGSYLAVPVETQSQDPCLVEKPDCFNPFRFYRLRMSKLENASKYQFTSTERHSLHFGYGKHACPGRFLAGTEIKILLALILRDFDIRLEEKKNKGRPRNWIYGLHVIPDPKGILEFRNRWK